MVGQRDKGKKKRQRQREKVVGGWVRWRPAVVIVERDVGETLEAGDGQ